jgi:hypothetical protein
MGGMVGQFVKLARGTENLGKAKANSQFVAKAKAMARARAHIYHLYHI